MKRLSLISVAAVLCFSMLAFGGYRLYQRHLSSDLKREIVACFDPTGSDSDVLHYVHDARLMVRTRKDSETLSKFESAIDMEIHSKTVRREYLAQQGEEFPVSEKEWKDAFEQEKRALKLVQEVRAEVGLPPSRELDR